MPRDSTLVTIFAGGNDVNVITAALGGGAGAANQTAFIDQQVQNFARDYTALVDGIRDRIGIWGPNRRPQPAESSRLPYVASDPLARRQAVHRAAVGMTTTAINPMTARGVRVVDLMCLAQLYAPSSLSSDGFHPSDAGYALIAAEVVRAVTVRVVPGSAGELSADVHVRFESALARIREALAGSAARRGGAGSADADSAA